MVNKLLYRSRQRGFLELDLLVGLWAERELPRMDAATLQQFTHVLGQVCLCAARKAASAC
jgi:succinate dehydrogenase flavin-adding protein (antitoxin of CptAB toxin-antitoxin module)